VVRRKTKKVVRGFSLSKRASDWIDERSPLNASGFVDALILAHWAKHSEEAEWREERSRRAHKLQMHGEDV